MSNRKAKGGGKGKTKIGTFRRLLKRFPFNNSPKYYLEDGTLLGRFHTEQEAVDFCKELNITTIIKKGQHERD